MDVIAGIKSNSDVQCNLINLQINTRSKILIN